MRNQTTSLILVLAILFFLVQNLVLINKNRNTKSEYTLILNEKNAQIQAELESYQNLKSRMFKAIRYEGYIPDQFSIFDSLKISEEYLILRFPELACNTCMDSILFNISRNLTQQELKKVIILIDNSYKQYMFQLKRFNQFVFPNIIEVSNSIRILSLDESKIPYFFMINKSKTCSMIFIPDRNKPEETKDYLSLIQKKIFNASKKLF